MENLTDIKVRTYDLPDIEPLVTNNATDEFFVWVPDKKYLVLGKGNQPEKSLYLEKVFEDRIEILKRPSGGETVILSPNTLVLSAVVTTSSLENPTKYFKIFNERIIAGLEYFGIKNLNQKGISDISIGEKKILGSSIYRTKDKIFYHAVLNVAETVETIEKYIKHPSREPDYRKGRRHRDFVTSLKNENYELDIFKLKNVLLHKSKAV